MKLAAIIKALLLWLAIVLLWRGLYSAFVLSEMIALVVGLVIGFLFDAAWNVNKRQYGLDFFEHYHWGLVMQLAAIYVLPLFGIPIFLSFLLFAVGLYLIIVEMVYQKHPFATGSNHELQSDLVGILIGLVVFYLAGYFYFI